MEGSRIMGHVTSPEKMHRGLAPHWIITAWIGIPSSGEFPLPSHPQACRARPRPPRRARAWARLPARTYLAATQGASLGTPASAHDRDPRARHGCGASGSAHVHGGYPGLGMPASAPNCDPRARHGRGPSGQRARKRLRPGARAWAGQPACTSATPTPLGPTSPEKMHRGAIAPY